MKHAGSALVSVIADHWRVSPPTARAILAQAGLEPSGSGWARYLWQEIWRLEGEIFVPPRDWSAFREPLLKTSQLP